MCVLICLLALAAPSLQAASLPPEDAKPRVIVLTDIGNEPDDSESMVRFLLYSNEFDVEGLLAVTSTWLRSAVHPELIEERVRAYGQVLPNLQVHASGYPPMETLLKRIKAGRPEYGMSGVGAHKDTEASKLIIAAVDRADPRPVWLTLWGGATDLAQALWTVRTTRSAAAVAKFTAKLRVYSISDQDDAGPWIRATFPSVFWIASQHAFNQYGLATWPGISGRESGADPTVVSPEWLDTNIRKGPLGMLYPQPKYLMEGDSPSFLYLIPTGLGSPEHPDWGSWGGRYGAIGPALGLWSDTQDHAKGIDGAEVNGNKVSIWRWRAAFQHDFAARIQWSMTSRFDEANHRPEVVLNGTSGHAPLRLTACADQSINLSAVGTRDPDGNSLTYRWWQYREATPSLNPQLLAIEGADSDQARVVAPVTVKPAPNVDIPPEAVYHLILSVTDNGVPTLTSYRRVVLTVPTAGTHQSNGLACTAGPTAPSTQSPPHKKDD